MHADLTSPMPSACSATTAHERPTMSRRSRSCAVCSACCLLCPLVMRPLPHLWRVLPSTNTRSSAVQYARVRLAVAASSEHQWDSQSTRAVPVLPSAPRTAHHPGRYNDGRHACDGGFGQGLADVTSPRSGATPAAPPPQGSAGTSGQRTQAVVDLVEAAMTADHPSRHTSAGQCRLVGRLGTGTSYCYHCHQQAACAPPRPALLRF